MKNIFYAFCAALVLSACTVSAQPRPTKVTLSDGTVVETRGGYGNGTFCPPGQAKKGNC